VTIRWANTAWKAAWGPGAHVFCKAPKYIKMSVTTCMAVPGDGAGGAVCGELLRIHLPSLNLLPKKLLIHLRSTLPNPYEAEV